MLTSHVTLESVMQIWASEARKGAGFFRDMKGEASLGYPEEAGIPLSKCSG